jgi:hypothetical protein
VTSAQRPPSQVVIGLDVGTTAVKAVAFGLASAWRRMAIREYPLLEPAPGWHEQDPKTILTATAAALTECVAAVSDAEVLAISLSAAMHGLVALDATMRPITPLVTWADSRARGEARSLRARGARRPLSSPGSRPGSFHRSCRRPPRSSSRRRRPPGLGYPRERRWSLAPPMAHSATSALVRSRPAWRVCRSG